jgi:hypothetical protein
MTGWKVAFALFIALLVVLLIAWLRIGGLKSDLKTAQGNFNQCAQTNKSNTDTIKALQGEVDTGAKSCESRLAVKEQTIRRLRAIDQLKGDTDEKVANYTSSGSDLLNELNRMWIREACDH